MSNKNIVRLKGNNIDLCILRIDEEAIDKYLMWMNDEEILPWIDRQDRVQQRNAQEKWVNKERDTNSKQFNIVTKEGILIGNCGFEVDRTNISGTIGIVIGSKDNRNKGYGTEAIKMLLDFGFNQCNLHRMELSLNEDNKRALRCYEKSGLKVVGTLHEDHFYNGHYCNTLYMEILKNDYLKLNN